MGDATGKVPVIQVVVFEDGTFMVAAKPDHRDEVGRALTVIRDALDSGLTYLIDDL